jgi:hypothetical protein
MTKGAAHVVRIYIVIALIAFGFSSCKTREARNSSGTKSDWAPDSTWESLGNGKKRRKWVMEWQCAIREAAEGGKRQDEYCEWVRQDVDKAGNLSCEFNANFVKNRKYYIPMRYDPDLPVEQRDMAWKQTKSNTYLALVKLVRQCSMKNAHCDKNKIAAFIDQVPQCQNADLDVQYQCVKEAYPKCHQDCYTATPYLAKDCLNKDDAECKGLELRDGKPNAVSECKTASADSVAQKDCIQKIAATCETACRVSCDENRSSDPQICSDLQRVLYDEGGELQPVTYPVITNVEGDKVLQEERLVVQLQTTSPDSLPAGCSFDVDPTLRPKLVAAGWDDAKIATYAKEEKTFIACKLDSASTSDIKSCDDFASQLRAGTQAWIVVDE